MKIKALAPWFGSKRNMAVTIAEELGAHRCFWEVFAGGMSVLLAKPKVSAETVNDLHGDLINLARIIQHARWGPMLYRRLRRTLVHEDLFWEAAARMAAQSEYAAFDAAALEGADAMLRAADFFTVSWLGRNGVIGTKQYNHNFCVRYTGTGGIQGTRFVSAVRSIPAWRRRLENVTILRRDGLELLERIEDRPGTAIYCDPPYLVKGASYVHDFEAADHQKLATALARFKRARVVVSYYAHPALLELYEGWTFVAHTRAKAMANQGKGGAKTKQAPEILIINGPSHALPGVRERLFPKEGE